MRSSPQLPDTRVADLLSSLPLEARARLRESPQPEWISPMLATLTYRRFSDPNWLFELKFDGERCLAFRNGSSVKLFSRNQKLLNNTYPEIADAIGSQALDNFVVDGEIVAFDGDVTSFSRLQRRMHIADPIVARSTGVEVFYYAFDMPYVAGYDTTAVGLRHRKSLLHQALSFDDPLRYTTHRDTEGEAAWREACARGWEGVIAKRAESSYVQRRSTDWLKFKCVNRQEFVIGGFTDPHGSRVGFGALLVGYYEGDYENGSLRYAGKIGTGYDTGTLIALREQLRKLETKDSPFAEPVKQKGAHWVQPELVAEVGFTEWTVDGKLRHPRFLGLRDDKPARSVVRERGV
jgi:bifunctional non-homologous end joining protein LigD